MSRSVSLTAEFRPYQEVDIHAKVSGYVRQINVDVGDHVKTGDVLAVLEIPELEEDLKKAQASVLTAQQEVQSAQAAFEETDQINTRMLAASKEAAGLIAQQDLDTAAAKNRATKRRICRRPNKRSRKRRRRPTGCGPWRITPRSSRPSTAWSPKRYADTGSLIQAGTTSNTQSMPLVLSRGTEAPSSRFSRAGVDLSPMCACR